MEFIMTFKKINKTGQAIIEYFILTTVVLAVVLFFSQSKFYKDVNKSLTDSTNQAITNIGFEEGDTTE
jgi:cell division protein FtsL